MEPERGCVIGLDLGGTKMAAGLFDAQDKLISSTYTRVSGLSPAELLSAIETTVRGLAEQSPTPVRGVGYGIPSTIDQRTGTVVTACNLPLRDLPFRAEMEKRLGVPAFLENDASVAALAEQRAGAARGAKVALMLTLGTGVGGGIVIDGGVVNGSIGAGAEIGHITIDRDGPPCTSSGCPNVGCLEAFCSGTALAVRARAFADVHPLSALAREAASGTPLQAELVVHLADVGDSDCQGLLREFGEALGDGMTTLVNIFNPDVLVLGGGVMAARQWFLERAIEVMRARALAPGNEFVEVLPAHFGNDAGMVGAAFLARDGLATAPHALAEL